VPGTNQYTVTASATNGEGTFVATTSVSVEPVPPTVTIASDPGNLYSKTRDIERDIDTHRLQALLRRKYFSATD